VLKIGVRLPRRFDDAGEYLADARALDAAGVDSLWLDDRGLDPWLLLAGIAAVTGRARLVAPVTPTDGLSTQSLHARLEALHRLSRGRAVLVVTAEEAQAAGAEAIFEAARDVKCCVLLQAASKDEARRIGRAADGVVVVADSADAVRSVMATTAHACADSGASFESWATIAMPEDRASWRNAHGAYEAAGATGVIVPADPRLLDLLRNGDEDDDRSDLNLAQG
jgi:alkanesulfonate monooxygenase SsuD/methylene tetrahydromethanopterin reductase-like flavin-dependent oxidoreductase (luciferase family)